MRQTLEDGVHQVADTVRNSLNFYRMQESAETVERAVLTGPGRRDPGLRRAARRAAAPAGRAARSSATEPEGADAGRLTVAAGLALDDTP